MPEISRNSPFNRIATPEGAAAPQRLECIEGECALGIGQASAQVRPCRVQLTKLSIHHQPHTYDEWRILAYCKAALYVLIP